MSKIILPKYIYRTNTKDFTDKLEKELSFIFTRIFNEVNTLYLKEGVINTIEPLKTYFEIYGNNKHSITNGYVNYKSMSENLIYDTGCGKYLIDIDIDPTDKSIVFTKGKRIMDSDELMNLLNDRVSCANILRNLQLIAPTTEVRVVLTDIIDRNYDLIKSNESAIDIIDKSILTYKSKLFLSEACYKSLRLGYCKPFDYNEEIITLNLKEFDDKYELQIKYEGDKNNA